MASAAPTNQSEMAVSASHVVYAASSAEGSTLIVDDVSLSVARGEFCAIIGPSGCGKTTFMNLVAGTSEPTAGNLLVNGTKPQVGPSRVMYAFARDALLPWRTAAQNIALPLEIIGESKNDIKDRVRELLDRVGLAGRGDSYRAELSQGMRQRVALARALAPHPQLLVMDEPFAALDAQTRVSMQEFLMEVLEKERTTVVFVTHDLEEAIALADHVHLFSRFPCHVSLSEQIDLGRPRSMDSLRMNPRFHELHDRFWGRLRDEVEGSIRDEEEGSRP